jgi:hypothetical protein
VVWVEPQHPIVEFGGGGRLFYETIEIANVLTAPLNDTRAIIIAGALMSRDHSASAKPPVERSNPLKAVFMRRRICRIQMELL